MTILRTGVDMIEVVRIEEAALRHGELFYHRFFTSAERAYCGERYAALAARFAAKEAGMKAIGTGLRHGVTWQDVEVVHLPGGRPSLRFSGVAAKFAERLGCKQASLSLTHTKEQAMAFVILEGE